MERLGVIGKPSDWLIASCVKKQDVERLFGMQVVDIPMDEVLSLGEVESGKVGAERIYGRLKEIVTKYDLQGLTLRCFDLLKTVKNTGCWALAKLNEEQIPAACEGDVPTLITMMLCLRLTNCPGFQANPARIERLQNGRCRLLLAHCTIPLQMVETYSLTTHFESGIGVAIHGELPCGDYTLLKVGVRDEKMRVFAEDVQLISNQYEPLLCRTQVWLDAPDTVADYLLHDPIANHHVIVPGHWAKAFRRLC